MRITIAAVGRWKRDPTRDLFETYRKRGRWEIAVKEVVAKRGGDAAAVQAEEAALLREALPERAVTVALDGRGRTLSSAGLADWLGGRRDEGGRDIAFVIGGADGLTSEILSRADLTLSLGAMTWPHMLVRAMLAEQLYRAQCILDGHPYHR
jgi:23S rRNA (pseudouridine1915-N3)-methyltransferase